MLLCVSFVVTQPSLTLLRLRRPNPIMRYILNRLSLDRRHSSRLVLSRVDPPNSPIRFRTNKMGLVKEDAIPLLDLEQQQQNALRISVDGVAFPSITWTEERKTSNLCTPRLLHMHLACLFVGFTATMIIFNTYRYPSTIPIFLGVAFVIVSWVVLRWYAVLAKTGLNLHAIWHAMAPWRRYGNVARYGFTLSTVFAIWLVYLSVLPVPSLELPDLPLRGERYFIVINLYSNEAIMPGFTTELQALVNHCEYPAI